MGWNFSRDEAWIPPTALIAGQLAHGVSWLMLAGASWPATPTVGMPELAWIHLVALGWLTLVALAVLVHVIPGFLDVDWKGEGIVRWCLLPIGLGAWGLVAGFWFATPWLLAAAGSLLVAALAVYATLTFWTIAQNRPAPGTRAPLKTGFILVLSALCLTAALGWLMATSFVGAPWAQVLSVLPPLHAVLGVLGWLTLLIFGVSTRTLFPITGRRRVPLPRHAIVSAALTTAIPLLLVGLWPGAHAAWCWAGIGAIAVAVVTYLYDSLRLLWKAPNPHRTPQAFKAASLVYLAGATVLAGGVQLGHPEWQAALVFVGLAGWVGQSVNAYLHHIGIRVLATMARGSEDDTSPHTLLTPALSGATFSCFQLAVVGGGALLAMGMGDRLMVPGLLGLAGWVCMMVNVARAWRRARKTGPAVMPLIRLD